jgi:pyruvate/2-oxoglutarate dehydrogenase complex dihydrolipoamide acyltransferase (E2) component
MAAVEVRFPAMSKDDPDAEGIVGTWFVREGQAVKAGQIIAEVQVEKVSQDVEAPTNGVVHLGVREEEPVRQGEVIATIET